MKIICTKWEVIEKNGVRSIQLYEETGRAVAIDEHTYWDRNFDCSNNQLTSLEGAPKEINGNFYCYSNQLTSFEGAPNEINGNFDCSDNKLISLKGAPNEINGSFYCYKNQLTSLEGAPNEINGNFNCSYNQLTSLEGAPNEINGNFDCSYNQLTSLEGAPNEINGSFYCYKNQLTSLEGAPNEINGNFDCSNNQLTSLEGAPNEINGNFYCYNNQLTSLKGAPNEINGSFDCSNNQLTSLEGAPNEIYTNMILKRIQKAKLKRGYLLVDNILAKIISKNESDGYDIFEVVIIGTNRISYCAKLNDTYAHGETKLEAILDIKFKLSNYDLSIYRTWSLDSTKPIDEMIVAYRHITKACRFGIRNFIKGKELPEIISISNVIELTKNEYGHEKFKDFFNEISNQQKEE